MVGVSEQVIPLEDIITTNGTLFARLAGLVHNIPFIIWGLLIIFILSTHLDQILFTHRHLQPVPVCSQAE